MFSQDNIVAGELLVMFKSNKDVDVILTPTTPTPAFKFGENIDDPIAMYLNDIFTVTANLAGLPAISLPIKYNKDGLPLALQLFGKSFDEQTLLKGEKIKKNLLSEFKIFLTSTEDISYRILPSPHFLIKDSKILIENDQENINYKILKKLSFFVFKNALSKIAF